MHLRRRILWDRSKLLAVQNLRSARKIDGILHRDKRDGYVNVHLQRRILWDRIKLLTM